MYLSNATPDTTGRSEWTATINGEVVPVEHASFSSKYGQLEWGKRPEGFTGWSWKEAGGGGVITLPYTYQPDDALLVALIEENRWNMGGLRKCAIGGFQDDWLTHAEAQQAEAMDEAGIDSREALEMGTPYNGNRLYFIGDPMKGEGVHAYALRIPFERLDANMQIPGAEGKLGKATFQSWRTAVLDTCGDALALAGIAKLVAQEHEQGRLK